MRNAYIEKEREREREITHADWLNEEHLKHAHTFVHATLSPSDWSERRERERERRREREIKREKEGGRESEKEWEKAR
jgi:hypothetical protein